MMYRPSINLLLTGIDFYCLPTGFGSSRARSAILRNANARRCSQRWTDQSTPEWFAIGNRVNGPVLDLTSVTENSL